MSFFRNRNCLNCVFFSESQTLFNPRSHTFSITVKKRKEIKNTNKILVEAFCCYHCYKGVWDCGISPNLKSKMLNIIKKRRGKNECYFVKFSEGMNFKTAEDLLERKRENVYRIKTRQISYIGIIIAMLGLLISFYK